ncbi:MAG: hypothetical protein HYT46_00685 [Candidatus Vogelbacteria bacterium]|nr:hypothetical protein [Candidatus Vogelbacteria bacterium]
MNSSQTILYLTATVSFIVMVAIISRASRRPIQNEVSNDGVSLAEVAAPWLTAAAAGFILTLKRSAAAAYLFFLLIGHRAAGTAKIGLHKIENRFLKLIEAVRGRGQRSRPEERRGAVSFFLEQIKVDKAETRRRANRRLISPP